MLPIYVKLFNIIFEGAVIPESWLIGEILPIYKNKGEKSNPENYRPITLLSCIGKLFTAIINSRLNAFADSHEVITNSQAGFRKGYSTADNIFIVNSLIEIMKASSKKLYCVFIDFRQAFDSVWRLGLWHKLISYNITGKCFRLIRSMYENIKSRVKYINGKSQFFPCTVGVRQGENLSPFLFAIFLNDLEFYFTQRGIPGINLEFNENDIFMFLQIFLLLYADDTVIFAESPEELQNALNAFSDYCDLWKLTVNVSKTKLLIISHGRPNSS